MQLPFADMERLQEEQVCWGRSGVQFGIILTITHQIGITNSRELREIKHLTPGHPGSCFQRKDSDSGLPALTLMPWGLLLVGCCVEMWRNCFLIVLIHDPKERGKG